MDICPNLACFLHTWNNSNIVSHKKSLKLNFRFISKFWFYWANIYIYIYIYMQSWKQCALTVITIMALWKHDVRLHIAGTIGYSLLVPSCFSEIWALCVSWITYGHLYYTPCLTCWALFGSLVPAMCNHTSWPETTFDN